MQFKNSDLSPQSIINCLQSESLVYSCVLIFSQHCSKRYLNTARIQNCIWLSKRLRFYQYFFRAFSLLHSLVSTVRPKPQSHSEPMDWISVCEGHVWIGLKPAKVSQPIGMNKVLLSAPRELNGCSYHTSIRKGRKDTLI